jgi:membrane-bound lytic murein transglycosylase A
MEERKCFLPGPNWGFLLFLSLNVACAQEKDYAHQSWRAEPSQKKSDAIEGTAPIMWDSAELTFPPENVFESEKSYLRTATLKQRDLCAKQDLQAKWNFGNRSITRKTWCLDVANRLLEIVDASASIQDLYTKVLNEFQWGQSKGRDGKGEVQFTGYYSPYSQVSRVKTAEYPYPMYAKPSDLVRVRVDGSLQWRRQSTSGDLSLYSPRADIQAGSLTGKGLEIAYFKTLFDAHLYEVQGSGLLEWVDSQTGQPTGETIWAQYAGQNGWTYRSIGSIVRDSGEAREYWGNLYGLRKFFDQFPDRAASLLSQNPSYVFFQLGTSGPMGASGVAVTTGHSLAADPAFYPFGTLAWVEAERFDHWAEGTGLPVLKKFSRLAWVQDTGGAIKGAGRFDYYWGASETSEARAGTMNSLGKIFIALPREK